MLSSIAFVGAGPTTIHTLAAFLQDAPAGIDITAFEAQPTAGVGTPYRPGQTFALFNQERGMSDPAEAA